MGISRWLNHDAPAVLLPHSNMHPLCVSAHSADKAPKMAPAAMRAKAPGTPHPVSSRVMKPSVFSWVALDVFDDSVLLLLSIGVKNVCTLSHDFTRRNRRGIAGAFCPRRAHGAGHRRAQITRTDRPVQTRRFGFPTPPHGAPQPGARPRPALSASCATRARRSASPPGAAAPPPAHTRAAAAR